MLTPSAVDWQDGLVACEISGHDGLRWTVTSPNANSIPQPFLGVVQVTLRSNYRYGPVDPIQHPQLFSAGFEYLCAVRRRVPLDHRFAPMWALPVLSDFHTIDGSVLKCLGRLTGESLLPLDNLVEEAVHKVENFLHGRHGYPTLVWLREAMCQARNRLRWFPSTFRDACLQTSEVQRYWLMCHAFMDYEALMAETSPESTPRSVRHEFMGAFTTAPEVAQQLFRAGVPFWFM